MAEYVDYIKQSYPDTNIFSPSKIQYTTIYLKVIYSLKLARGNTFVHPIFWIAEQRQSCEQCQVSALCSGNFAECFILYQDLFEDAPNMIVPLNEYIIQLTSDFTVYFITRSSGKNQHTSR